MFEELKPEEKELVGMWLDLGGRVTGDAVCDRVIWLTTTCLEKLAEREADMSAFYRDPRDDRYWERLLPFPDGPPTLRNIKYKEAMQKYGICPEASCPVG
jgi:immunity protein 27 of polymorphic toxin system